MRSRSTKQVTLLSITKSLESAHQTHDFTPSSDPKIQTYRQAVEALIPSLSKLNSEDLDALNTILGSLLRATPKRKVLPK